MPQVKTSKEDELAYLRKEIWDLRDERQKLLDSNRELLTALTDCVERMEKCRSILREGPNAGFWGILDITEAKTAISKSQSITLKTFNQ